MKPNGFVRPNLLAVTTPWLGALGVVTLTDVKDAVAIVVSIVGAVCTVLIAHSNIKKNRIISEKSKKPDSGDRCSD